MKKIFLFLLISSPLFLSCSATDIDKIRDAQTCLDEITPATTANARTCMQKISGVNSPAASMIRCSALLTVQGLDTTTTLASVLAGIIGYSGTPSLPPSNVLVMTAIGFQANGGAAADEADVATAVTECNNSGSLSLGYLAAMAHAGTYAKYAGGCSLTIVLPPDAATGVNLNCVKTYVNGTYATTAAVASLLYSEYKLSCTSSSTTAFCTGYSAAITAAGGTSNLLAVANSFFANAN